MRSAVLLHLQNLQTVMTAVCATNSCAGFQNRVISACEAGVMPAKRIDGGADRMANQDEESVLLPAAAPDWELPGNDGWNFFRGHLLGVLQREAGPSYLAEVQLRGNFWYVPEAINAPDVVPDFSIILHQIELPRTRLIGAVTLLENWLASYDPVDLELSVGNRYRSLHFSIQAEQETIFSRHHPVFRLRFATERFAGEARFVVDQSCIRLWLVGLKSWLEKAAIQQADSGEPRF
jgi:hypothetical protein